MKNILKLSCFILLAGCGASHEKESSCPEKKPEEKKVAVKDTTPKVTGIGGIFFMSKDPKSTNEWYGKQLGLAIDDYGSPFEFRNTNNPDEINYLRWSAFTKGNSYF